MKRNHLVVNCALAMRWKHVSAMVLSIVQSMETGPVGETGRHARRHALAVVDFGIAIVRIQRHPMVASPASDQVLKSMEAVAMRPAVCCSIFTDLPEIDLRCLLS